MNRIVVTLTLVLLAAIGGQTRAVAKALTDPNIASGGFAENCDTLARFHAPQPLDFAAETNHRGYETASGRRKWLNRDPIEESGGLNLNSAFLNAALQYVDILGLSTPDDSTKPCGSFWVEDAENIPVPPAQQGAAGGGVRFVL